MEDSRDYIDADEGYRLDRFGAPIEDKEVTSEDEPDLGDEDDFGEESEEEDEEE